MTPEKRFNTTSKLDLKTALQHRPVMETLLEHPGRRDRQGRPSLAFDPGTPLKEGNPFNLIRNPSEIGEAKTLNRSSAPAQGFCVLHRVFSLPRS